MALDEENILRHKERSSYEAIYMKASIVGSSETSFIPPPRDGVKGSRIYLAFCNYGSNPAHLSYDFKVLREAMRQYATTQYEALETQKYELTRPLSFPSNCFHLSHDRVFLMNCLICHET